MATPFLKRSVETFRRYGSSGMVWDDRFTEDKGVGESEGEAMKFMELRHARSVGGICQEEYRQRTEGPHLSRSSTASPARNKLPVRSFPGFVGNRRPKSLAKESKNLISR